MYPLEKFDKNKMLITQIKISLKFQLKIYFSSLVVHVCLFQLKCNEVIRKAKSNKRTVKNKSVPLGKKLTS